MKIATLYDSIFFTPEASANDETIFSFCGQNQRGELKYIELYEHISIMFNDFEANYIEPMQVFENKLLSINYCFEGRIECTVSKNKHVSLNAGQLLLVLTDNHYLDFQVPFNMYKGMTVIVDYHQLSDTMKSLLASNHIQLDSLIHMLQKSDYCVISCDQTVQHLFSDILTSAFKFDRHYLKMKTMECLYILTNLDVTKFMIDSDYYEDKHYQIVKKVANYVTNHLSEHVTLVQLSKEFGVSDSFIKKNFKRILGMPITTYIQKYRIHQSCILLKNTEEPIVEIALKVGYQNPSKFTELFKREKNITPLEYRRMSRLEQNEMKQ